MIPRLVVGAFSLFALLGAAGAHAALDKDAAATAPQEELLLVESGSSHLWAMQPLESKPPRYSDKLMHRRVGSCTTVGMVIERDGTTSGHRILSLRMDPQARERDAALRALVEEWAIAAAQQYRFAPGPDNPDAGPGYTAMAFGAARAGSAAAADCAVDDLRAAIASAPAVAP